MMMSAVWLTGGGCWRAQTFTLFSMVFLKLYFGYCKEKEMNENDLYIGLPNMYESCSVGLVKSKSLES